MIEALSTFLEKLPAFAAKSGLIIMVVGVALIAGLRFGAIDPHALNGYVAQGAPVLAITGAAMVGGSVLIALLSWLGRSRRFVQSFLARREHAQRLRENIEFLDTLGRLMLLVVLNLPRCRVPSDDHPSIARMLALGLLEREFTPGVFLASPFLRLAPTLYKSRVELKSELEQELGERLGRDLSGKDELADVVQAETRKVGYISWRDAGW